MTTLRLCVRRSTIARPAGDATAVSLRLPSDVDCIEEAVALLTYHCIAGDPEGDRLRFRLQVVLAEAIANAILRGNRQDHTKWVDVEAILEPAQVSVHVTDQGSGFDPDRVPDATMPERREHGHGRGLFLIRHLADEVTFNPTGNSVRIILLRR